MWGLEKRDFILFLLASAVIGVTQSIDISFFNNFLSDNYHLTISQRTFLEIPREFPGFAVVFMTGLLFAFGDVRTAAIANLLGGLGSLGLAFWSPEYLPMIGWLTVYSMGQHLFMPMANSIGMNLASEGQMGKRLGQINSVNTAVFLATSLATALLFRYIKIDYHLAFSISAGAFFLSAVLILMMKPHSGKRIGKRFVLRKEYKVFYGLSILFGARKQIFITFGPWVLIKVFSQDVATFAILSFIIAGLGIFFKPFIGYLIDSVGERFVLAGESVSLIFVCLGYAFTEGLLETMGLGKITLYVVCGLFVLDQMLVSVSMARATYVKRIALNSEDVSPTLSMGITLDHIVSMFVPFLGGFIWTVLGYEYVFVIGAAIAALNLLLTTRMKPFSQLPNKDSAV
ncbi:MFS transporter [Desulfosporosinus sp. BICA1-9]|uniref:MFS transporter n=1 Tax=Desulfosporosinus sp. BICA1-9 TaxID=1531958 RepID=UPI00054BEB9F|nr:MFS transporter [Desulfosporosinus sp. BICA1-9]KJS49167.1 MAG: MFS transporter [Peptococcaceae bacterium BRH_c23]KJS90662.1 MAG: MFS transporter [Desulfosporosinus sp. BICA1-9]HBW37228.1 MFS transporter [Desulfosporosinus sp.]